jgi:hypothetical protein
MKKEFWDFMSYSEKKWFQLLLITLSALVIIYITLHLVFSNTNKFEYIQLNTDQTQQINRIYFDTDSTSKRDIDNIKKDTPNTTANQTVDTPKFKIASQKKDSCNCEAYSKNHRVIKYLTNEFDGKIDTTQLDSLNSYLRCARPLEAVGFLFKVRFKVHSYFWLSDPSIYFEIIFWTWFGVIASLLFNIGQVSRNSTNNPKDLSTYFDSSEIPSQVAKIAYAPLCTLIIVFGYHLFNDKSLADISSGKGVIVFGFIGGFYSSRLISFLDRLKDLLLPNSGKTDLPVTKQPSLKNVVILITPPQGIETTALSAAKVTLTYELTGEITSAINIDKTQPAYFIADYIKPGIYKINTELDTKSSAGTPVIHKSEQKIEMKTEDLFVSVQLTSIE